MSEQVNPETGNLKNSGEKGLNWREFAAIYDKKRKSDNYSL
jgi:hypothetical protein